MSAFARFLFLCFARARYVIINTEEILSQITKESIVRSIISSPIEQKQRKRTRKNVSAMREEVVFHSPQKCDFVARNDGKRAREKMSKLNAKSVPA